MDCFEKFDPIDGDVPFYPFFDLFDVAWQARGLLEGMSRRDICWIELDVDSTVEQMRELYGNSVARNNDPAEADLSDPDDEPSEVEALKMSLSAGRIACEPGSPGDSPVRCAAVLALMFVARCIETLECSEEDLGTADDGPVAARLIPAANDAINAALALGLALMYESASELEGELEVALDEHVADFSKERARRAAHKRHAENRSMKADVFTWLDSQEKFKSIEAAATAITKQQPIAHVTGRDWYKEWKKLRSASTP